MKAPMHNLNSEITVILTEDAEPQWIYLIEGVFYQQKGYSTKVEAMVEGKNKLNELLNN